VKTVCIDQGSSIIGVCVVYGLISLVHPFYYLYKPLKEKEEEEGEEEIVLDSIHKS
jgi:hypothetical protein